MESLAGRVRGFNRWGSEKGDVFLLRNGKLGGGFQAFFIFTPKIGEMIQFE